MPKGRQHEKLSKCIRVLIGHPECQSEFYLGCYHVLLSQMTDLPFTLCPRTIYPNLHNIHLH